MGNEFFYPTISIDENISVQNNEETILTESLLQVLNQLNSTIVNLDEIEIIKSNQSISNQEIVFKDHRIEAARARQLLVVINVIKKAIERNDEQSICRWYDEKLFHGSMEFSDEEKKKISEAINRQVDLEKFRQHVLQKQFEQANNIYLQSNLSYSNLLLTNDIYLFQNLSSEQKFHSNVIGSELFESNFKLSDPQITQHWLEGDLIQINALDNLQDQALINNIRRIGFNARIERALKAKNKKYLLRLLRSDKDSHLFSYVQVGKKVESFLGIEALPVDLSIL